MISIRRILGLLALAGTIGLGAESRAQAQTVQPRSAGVATAGQKIQFAQLLLGQEGRSISGETTLTRQQNQVIDQALASVAPSAPQRSPSLARQFQTLQGRSALTQTQIDPIVARPSLGGRLPRPRLNRRGRLKTGQQRRSLR